MKILYLSQGQFNDYQCDMLLHGLRCLLGPDVVDVQRIRAMYRTTGPGSYSVWGLLPDDSYVDRSDIAGKLSSKYFDLVIYGSIWHDLSYIDVVTEKYPPSRIVFVDGLDDDPRYMHQLEDRGYYLRREHHESRKHSIQFAIPREKIIHDPGLCVADKIRIKSPLDPRDRSTYIYTNEKWYYRQYQESFFGLTMKKGGWDCMRHYEIMAAGAMPYFMDLESCPSETMKYLPKEDLILGRQLCDRWSDNGMPTSDQISEWAEIQSRIHKVLLNDLTTEAMAKRVLDLVGIA